MPATSMFATADNAAAVDANPPLLTLLKAVRDAVDVPGKGDAVVYWMRMTDTRSQFFIALPSIYAHCNSKLRITVRFR